MNLQLTNLSVQFPNDWSAGSVSASFQQRQQGGRLNFSGSLTIPLDEIKDFDKLTMPELSEIIAKMVLDKIENGEIIPDQESGEGIEDGF